MDAGSPNKIEVNGGQRSFSVKPGTSVLVALASKGAFLPSACGGKGECGYCRLRITQPPSPHNARECALINEADRTAGFHLACQTIINQDLSVEIPDEYFLARRHTGVCSGKRLLTHDILSVHIDLPASKPFEFAAGQYILLKTAKYGDRGPVLRAYSISSRPSCKSFIELMIRKVPDGIGTTWVFDHLTEGTEVQFIGPYGSMRLPDSAAPVLFVAGGSGMAPLWSMVQDMHERKTFRRIWYFFGALTRGDLFLLEELREMELDMPGFTFIPALSSEPAGSDWNGERGLITEVLTRRFPAAEGIEAYLCGSPGLIRACMKVLAEKGLPADRIFFDKFE